MKTKYKEIVFLGLLLSAYLVVGTLDYNDATATKQVKPVETSLVFDSRELSK